jgi:hypothetical protein
MKFFMKKSGKNKQRSTNENITTKTYVPKNSSKDLALSNSKSRDTNTPLQAISSESSSKTSSTSSNSKEKDLIIKEVLLADFKFSPKTLRIKTDTTVKWIIGENKNSHESGIYTMTTRSFVIRINDIDVESELLHKGESFVYTFDKAGTYEIECANYTRIKGVIEVYEDEAESMMSKLQENYRERVNLFGSEINDLLKHKPKQSKSSTTTTTTIVPVETLVNRKDLENDRTKMLLLELSSQKSSKMNKSIYCGSASESEEEKNDKEEEKDDLRESLVLPDRHPNNISNQSCDYDTMNFLQEWITRDFHDEDFDSKSDFKFIQSDIRFQPERNALDDLIDSEMQPPLVNLKNRADEEQKFALTTTNTEEINAKAIEEKEDAIEESTPSDNFLLFLKKSINENKDKLVPSKIYSKVSPAASEYVERGNSRIDAMKEFLLNSNLDFIMS